VCGRDTRLVFTFIRFGGLRTQFFEKTGKKAGQRPDPSPIPPKLAEEHPGRSSGSKFAEEPA